MMRSRAMAKSITVIRKYFRACSGAGVLKGWALIIVIMGRLSRDSGPGIGRCSDFNILTHYATYLHYNYYYINAYPINHVNYYKNNQTTHIIITISPFLITGFPS